MGQLFLLLIGLWIFAHLIALGFWHFALFAAAITLVLRVWISRKAAKIDYWDRRDRAFTEWQRK